MACVCGLRHTVTVSDDGVVHSFGNNENGQLGLGHNNEVSIPSHIPNLPKIKQVSCGLYFTVCVDEEGFLWSFGGNRDGQIEINSNTNSNIPQQILNIPPVLSVSCGFGNILIITIDSDLWSCGYYTNQLCHGKGKNQSIFQKTAFSNISKISSGSSHLLFQNDKGEIFSCGHNVYGQLGLGQACAHLEGHSNSSPISPIPILNAPLNIVHFVCGGFHSLFLDSEGNVYSVGCNSNGQLGLGHKENQNVLNQIPNIPPIQFMSCGNSTSYLIDFEGNVWSFGYNGTGGLGHGDTNDRTVPTKIESLKDIQQISHGPCGDHFFAKDSQNAIFVSGYNGYCQLGLDTETDVAIPDDFLNSDHLTQFSEPKEINAEYFSIWGEVVKSKAKSARK